MVSKGKFICATVGGGLVAVLIVMLLVFDVAAVGPRGSTIGFSHLNKGIFDAVGVSDLWMHITDGIIVASIVIASIFAILGVVQWAKRSSWKKADQELMALGALYTIVIGLYILSEFVVINYRPIIMPGATELETAFPSAHTMVAFVIFGSAILMMNIYIKNKPLRLILQIICVAVIVVMFMGRLMAGVHWFTDIVGAVLIGASLLIMFSGLLDNVEDKKDNWAETHDKVKTKR